MNVICLDYVFFVVFIFIFMKAICRTIDSLEYLGEEILGWYELVVYYITMHILVVLSKKCAVS